MNLLPDAWSGPPETERIDPTDTAAWVRASSQRLGATGTDAADPRDLMAFERTGRERTANRSHQLAKAKQDSEWRQQVHMDRNPIKFARIEIDVPLPRGMYNYTIIGHRVASAMQSVQVVLARIGESMADIIKVMTAADELPAVRLRSNLPEHQTMRSTARIRQPILRRLDISHGRRSKHPP